MSARWDNDASARHINRTLRLAAIRARESALGIDDSDGAAALRGLANAAGEVASWAGAIAAARDGVADMHALSATLADLIGNVGAHYATPALSAVDLRNIRLDERSKAHRENV